MITKFQTNNIFTTNIYDDIFYKICIVRNPYERIIELFYSKETKYSESNLNNFIINDLNKNSLIEQSNYLKYCNIGLSFKNITSNLNYILKIILFIVIIKIDKKIIIKNVFSNNNSSSYVI